MDIRMIVKILAVLAIVALSYKMWEARTAGPAIPQPYEGFDDDDEEGDVYHDFEDSDGDYEDSDDDYEDSDDDSEDDFEDDSENDFEDDSENDYENDDDSEDDFEDDYEDDYEVSASAMKPSMPLLSPSSKLLPRPSIQAQDFAKYAPKELGAQNFLTATQWIGVNTQGSSLRNANYDIRANPVISKKDVGPWGQSTIDPDVYTKPLF